MFLSNKRFNEYVEKVDNNLIAINKRLDVLESVTVKIIDVIKEHEKTITLEEDTNHNKLFDALVKRSVEHTDTLTALLKSDEDRIKALNITMDKVEEVSDNIGTLARILSEKGIITIDDLT